MVEIYTFDGTSKISWKMKLKGKLLWSNIFEACILSISIQCGDLNYIILRMFTLSIYWQH